MRANRFLSTSFAILLLAGVAGAVFAQTTDQDEEEHHPGEVQDMPTTGPGGGMPGMMGRGMMGQQGMMGPQMMPQGMMGHGMMGRGMMGPDVMRVMFILMDTDGDGALSLEEVQAAHGRIFRAIDTDGDGRVTLQELQAFMRGSDRPAQ